MFLSRNEAVKVNEATFVVKAVEAIESPRKFKVGTHYNVLDVENKTVLVLYELD